MRNFFKQLGLLIFRRRIYFLILRAFVGPFLVTFALLEVIFLTWHMIKYMDYFQGKGLGVDVYAEVVFYFAFQMVPRVLPLTIMISSLIAYGNLGEHNELTAIKSSGISLTKLLVPTFVISSVLAFSSYIFADKVIPKTNLKAYSLLYDIKTKKPALNVDEGVFYTGLDGYRIRVEKMYPDGYSLKHVTIYDHTKGRGNTDVIVADSGQMRLDPSEQFMFLDLFNGTRSAENYQESKKSSQEYTRMHFAQSKMIFDLTSLQLKDTPEKLFSRNKYMLNAVELTAEMDSLKIKSIKENEEFEEDVNRYHPYGMAPEMKGKLDKDSSATDSLITKLEPAKSKSYALNGVTAKQYQEVMNGQQKKQAIQNAYNQAKSIGQLAKRRAEYQLKHRKDAATFGVEKLRKYSEALSCIIMFMIGAPLGAVLKKGGLGVPFLITVVFFVLYYFVSTSFEKFARQDVLDLYVGAWMADVVLFPIGVFFLYQAYRDGRLF